MSHLTDFQDKCNKITALFNDDLTTLKTGRAKPSLVEHLKVQAYGGSWMEVRELASISAPDAQTIVISPWDKSVLKDLERGIAGSELRLNPVVSGEIIRIAIPPLTEETRRDLVKLMSQKAEAHRAMVRQERTHFKKEIEDEKNVGGVSEDDVKRNLENLQKITDETIKKIDDMVKAKEQELMTV
ncbi:ribosome recycling factor [Candidatus Beckwithbacteria bacterium]|nr:ribosome recycling factor [Candidatus Beckwithbacteria bacterium]